MKATELQIGDWYVNSDGDKCRVIKNFGNEVWGEGDNVSDATDNPQPIPLTQDILEKNGFTKTGKLSHQTKDGVVVLDAKYWELNGLDQSKKYYHVSVNLEDTKYKYKFIGISSRLGYLEINSIPITVDILQHALRLCGLNELANNFKI